MTAPNTEGRVHTPGPWRSELDNVFGGPNDRSIYVADCAPMGGPVDGRPDQVANAAFIVRACNSHYALIEALTEARAALHQHYVDWDGEPEDAVPLQIARTKCDEALALATKGAGA